MVSLAALLVAVGTAVWVALPYYTATRPTPLAPEVRLVRENPRLYSDLADKRLEHWYLAHVFVVCPPENQADYDRAVQSVRETVDKESAAKRLEYLLKEEALVMLFLRRYEQNLALMDEPQGPARALVLEDQLASFRQHLTRNPRVLHFWDQSQQTFSNRLRQDVAGLLKEKTYPRDKDGPFQPPSPTSRVPPANKLQDLNDDFRANYRLAKETALRQTRFVVVVAGDDVVLLHQGQRASERFTPEIYHTLKAVAHVPLNVFAILGGRLEVALPQATLDQLARTRDLIRGARQRLAEVGFSDQQLERQKKILDALEPVVEQAIQVKRIERDRFHEVIKNLTPLVMANAEEAAQAQLDGLHAAIGKWREQHGPVFLEQVHVIVMGSPPPRRRNLAIQYFARLLNLQGESSRLVYAESTWDEDRALNILGTRLVDDAASAAFFGDKDRLQIDLLAEAAEQYLPKLLPK